MFEYQHVYVTHLLVNQKREEDAGETTGNLLITPNITVNGLCNKANEKACQMSFIPKPRDH